MHPSSSRARLAPLSRFMTAVVPLILLTTGMAGSQPAPSADEIASRIDGHTVLGDVVPFGQGTARTWVRLDDKDQPVSLGITLTEAALEGLPTRATPGLIWMVEYVVPFPSDIPLLPFDHAGVNWNPQGHMPGGIYDTPHFDFHFYTISPEQRTLITARGDDIAKCQKVPTTGALPDGYVYADGAEEPGMGGHWADPNSHEFHGNPFTSTFIFGTHDGQVIFWEPMITKALLEERQSDSIAIPQPSVYAETGYFPTNYSMAFDEKRREYTVSLDGLTLRKGSDSVQLGSNH